jgi:hypothetical protein
VSGRRILSYMGGVAATIISQQTGSAGTVRSCP